MRTTVLGLVTVAVISTLVGPSSAYVEVLYTLPQVINESTNIVVMQVERVNKERKLIIYKKLVDLKGKHPTDVIKHNVGVGGFNAKEQAAPTEWAEPGKIAIFFHNGGASETCIGKYWYQAYSGGEWWNHSHGEPYMCRTYCGEIQGLRDAVEKLMKGDEVIIPCTVSKTDLRIQKVRATMKVPLAHVVTEAPSIEKTPLTDVAGFSELLELPPPQGRSMGAIAIDFDGDGWTDLLMINSRGLRLLKNNHKGNFDDVTDKWGLSNDKGCKAAAFADYNRSGRPSLLTSTGQLYTNLGDKFRDDSKLLPKTPARVRNPGEAFAWADINGDGLPDIICSLGVKGLAAFVNKGGAGDVWFEDASEAAGLGEKGLAGEIGNYLTSCDLNGDGKTDFIFNQKSPLIALNQGGKFAAVTDTGIRYPGSGRPAVSYADFLSNGTPGLFVTANERRGAIADWFMIGTFSQEEDKEVAAGPDFSPKTRPTVKIGEDSWNWQPARIRSNGALEIRRGQPTPNVAYAFTIVDWPQAETVTLHIGSENGLTIWLNGQQVHNFEGKRLYMPDIDRVDVPFKKGPNHLLIKSTDDAPVWRSCVRVLPTNLYPPPGVQLYQSDGRGKFTDVTRDAGDLAQLRADCVAAVWGDLNNDGLPDLVVTSQTGLVRVYLNKGGGKFHYATADLGLEQKFKASGVIVADFNKDGKLDLVLLGNDPDPCIALMSKVAGKFAPLTVRFGGPDSATGALVRVSDMSGKIQASQQISGGDGRTMQAAQDARFALPPGKYRVEVRYTSGATRIKEVDVADKPIWEVIDDKTPIVKK
jgi:hypothetical protein